MPNPTPTYSRSVAYGLDDHTKFFLARGEALSQPALTGAQIKTLDTLFSGLRTNNFWGKFILFDPIIGGTAGWHSINAVGARNQITWNGTITHNASGVDSDGVTGYGSTGFISNSGAITLGYYTNALADGASIGANDGGAVGLYEQLTILGNVAAADISDGSTTASFTGPPNTGLIVGNREIDAGGTVKLFVQGVLRDTVTGGGNDSSGFEQFLLAVNEASVPLGFTTNAFQLFFISQASWTDAEMVTLNTLIQAYQTALGRNV